MIIEYVEGGELFEYIVQHGRLTEEESFKFFQQIMEGVEYCHENLICHRDLKPENLLLDQNLNIKIADFGMASLMSEDFLVETSCGSPHYASPEVVTGGKYNGMKADIWSCGVILFALLAGTLPFDDDNVTTLLNKVKKGVFKIPSHFPEDVRDLIQQMLCVDPSKRISIRKIKQHDWWKRMSQNQAQRQSQNIESQIQQTQQTQQIQQDLQDQQRSTVEQPHQIETQLLDMSIDEDPNASIKKSEVNTISNQNIETTEQLQDSIDSKDYHVDDNENHSIVEIDNNLIEILVSMGWVDKDKLIEALHSKDKNIETVTYKLLQQKSLQNVEDDIFGVNPKLRVSITNPLSDPIEPLEMMKKLILEAEKLQQEHEKNQEKKQSFLSKIFKAKKKTDNLATFEIESEREEFEAFSELSKIFNELKIGLKKTGQNSGQATCTENPVIFDVSTAKREDNQTIIRFVLVKGNPYTAGAIVQAVKDQMQIE